MTDDINASGGDEALLASLKSTSAAVAAAPNCGSGIGPLSPAASPWDLQPSIVEQSAVPAPAVSGLNGGMLPFDGIPLLSTEGSIVDAAADGLADASTATRASAWVLPAPTIGEPKSFSEAESGSDLGSSAYDEAPILAFGGSPTQDYSSFDVPPSDTTLDPTLHLSPPILGDVATPPLAVAGPGDGYIYVNPPGLPPKTLDPGGTSNGPLRGGPTAAVAPSATLASSMSSADPTSPSLSASAGFGDQSGPGSAPSEIDGTDVNGQRSWAEIYDTMSGALKETDQYLYNSSHSLTQIEKYNPDGSEIRTDLYDPQSSAEIGSYVYGSSGHVDEVIDLLHSHDWISQSDGSYRDQTSGASSKSQPTLR